MARLLILVTALWSVAGFSEIKAGEKYQFKAAEIKLVSVHNSTGNVSIAPITGKIAHVFAQKMKWGPRCKINVDLEDGRLAVEVDDSSSLLDHECRVDLIVSVPQEVAMRLRAGTGDIKIVATRGDVDVIVGSGLISLKGDIANLKALSGSGDIRLEGTAKTADLKTGAGDIDIDYRAKVSSGNLQVSTGSGDVQILLPPESSVKSLISTGNGTVVNDFAANPEGTLNVGAASESGDIQIRKK